MKKLSVLLVLFVLLGAITFVNSQEIYFPERGDNWQTKPPSGLKVNADKLELAVNFAKENEYSESKDLRVAILNGFQREPFHYIAGPTKKRGGPAGVILKNGYIIAQWGDVNRVDMTFSVTKSYLSTVAGLALDEGLISDVSDKTGDYVWDRTFDGEHNSKITWAHLLNQSSDWSGELFGMKDWADRPPRDGGIDDWKNRKLNEPGTFFKYNDVRVNVLSYSLLQVWRKPLPQVLKEKIMDPIGASTTWRWFGYDHAWVNVDGLQMKSVTGGGHSGGGVFINTLDHARFGLLFMNNGNWNGKQLISENWIEQATTPSTANESYGYMWWLNKGPRKIEGVPEHVFNASGFGGNYIVVDQINNLVIVTRWLNPSKMGEMMKLVYDSLK
ncbi:MAG: serine hydrolase [Prolixibacteraceae bacterium]|nr:serine hydrolase [Prolixibacteraceae bacterium]MBT6004868.1 serine hydrolase [Prolixibacteraceae bacterium]MBT6763930.1 serine hydrolase [Prolixibacteraceae bacterium]MBT6998102.1 serine hydrolase [Prolixibacteraceae bacterium]MBT7394624.1 serine hydrolase [Prolixibacteraceae bacterium]